MKWKTMLKIDFYISLILALFIMIGGAVKQGKLVCGIFTSKPFDCSFFQWMYYIGIFFIIFFVIIIIIVIVFKILFKKKKKGIDVKELKEAPKIEIKKERKRPEKIIKI